MTRRHRVHTIHQRQLQRARRQCAALLEQSAAAPSPTRLAANPAKLEHIQSRESLPSYYEDLHFVCIDCGQEELWTAAQQKWWYEEAKNPIDAITVRCQNCRQQQRRRKEQLHRRREASKDAASR